MLNIITTPDWIAKGTCECGFEVEAPIPRSYPAFLAGKEAESRCIKCNRKVMVLIPEKPHAVMIVNPTDEQLKGKI